jgi:hypothetical protein
MLYSSIYGFELWTLNNGIIEDCCITKGLLTCSKSALQHTFLFPAHSQLPVPIYDMLRYFAFFHFSLRSASFLVVFYTEKNPVLGRNE